MDRVRIGPVKGLKIAVAAFVMSVVLFAAVVGLGIYVVTHKSNEGSETHEAVCALVADLENRAEATHKFLHEHPNGIPGIPVKTLREGMENQERTIDALSVVHC